MSISCVIMAGGKSSRMKNYDEKTIILILGKPMIEYVIESALGSNVEQVMVATSPYTPKTTNLIKNYNLSIIKTAGKGYHEDIREIIEQYTLEIILTISGDLPLITKNDINRVIEFYKNSKKSSLSVMSKLENFNEYHLKPSYIMEYKGQKVVPIGINLIDGRNKEYGWQDETILLVDEIQFLLNVNTEQDLEAVQKVLKNSNNIN